MNKNVFLVEPKKPFCSDIWQNVSVLGHQQSHWKVCVICPSCFCSISVTNRTDQPVIDNINTSIVSHRYQRGETDTWASVCPRQSIAANSPCFIKGWTCPFKCSSFHILHCPSPPPLPPPPPPLLCSVVVLSRDSAAQGAALKETHVLLMTDARWSRQRESTVQSGVILH